ncbi:unnamed protein product [Moneuplotes crassus]|uniref:Protein kinase domain-containing protein n=1 Tax=Euplotes crassus TaxID=5936 RepID=A0AAD1Y2V6_EUPCR|nr:unnamed protein product [Moneuplotes crassus]
MGNEHCCKGRGAFEIRPAGKVRSDFATKLNKKKKKILLEEPLFEPENEVIVRSFYDDYKIQKKFLEKYPISYIFVTDKDGQKFIAKFYDKSDDKKAFYYKDLVFSSVLSHHHQIPVIKDSYINEMVIVEEIRSERTLLSEMISASSKTPYPISYAFALVAMKQIVKVLNILNEYKIFHGNLIPSNIIFKEAKNWLSLNVTGLERSCLIEENSIFDKKFDNFNVDDGYYSKMSMYTEVRKKFSLEETKDVPNMLYYAPELAKGFPTEKSDIWSAGIIFYQMLSKEHPFEDLVHLSFNEYSEKLEMNSLSENYLRFDSPLFLDSPQEILDLISKMLIYDAPKRIGIEQLNAEIIKLNSLFEGKIKREVRSNTSKKEKQEQSKEASQGDNTASETEMLHEPMEVKKLEKLSDQSVEFVKREAIQREEPLYTMQETEEKSSKSPTTREIELNKPTAKQNSKDTDEKKSKKLNKSRTPRKHKEVKINATSEQQANKQLRRDQKRERQNFPTHQDLQRNQSESDNEEKKDVGSLLNINNNLQKILMKADPRLFEKIEGMKNLTESQTVKDEEKETKDNNNRHEAKKHKAHKRAIKPTKSQDFIDQEPEFINREDNPLDTIKAINMKHMHNDQVKDVAKPKTPKKAIKSCIMSTEKSAEFSEDVSAEPSIDPSDISNDQQSSQSNLSYKIHAKLIIYAMCLTNIASDSRLEKIQKRFLRIGNRQQIVEKDLALTYFGKKIIDCSSINDDTKEAMLGFLNSKDSYDSVAFIQDYLAVDCFLDPDRDTCDKIFESISQGKPKVSKSVFKNMLQGQLEPVYPDKDADQLKKIQRKMLKMITQKDKKITKDKFLNFMLK